LDILQKAKTTWTNYKFTC